MIQKQIEKHVYTTKNNCKLFVIAKNNQRYFFRFWFSNITITY